MHTDELKRKYKFIKMISQQREKIIRMKKKIFNPRNKICFYFSIIGKEKKRKKEGLTGPPCNQRMVGHGLEASFTLKGLL